MSDSQSEQLQRSVPAGLLVLVKGVGDVGSAVAHLHFRAGLRPVILDTQVPSTARRRMSFADALFDGQAILEGVQALRVDTPAQARELCAAGQAIPVLSTEILAALAALSPSVVVDARMRKQERPEPQRGEAPLTIGLGPGFRAREIVDAAIETNWGPNLGRVLWAGEPEAYTGQPRAILGFARERYVYAPHAGCFHTEVEIGTPVTQGQPIARVENTPLLAQIGGVVRGITRDGAYVRAGAKVIDIDPRGEAEQVGGIGERPRQIAAGVLAAIREWHSAAPESGPPSWAYRERLDYGDIHNEPCQTKP
jgi:xanthine dehydrogenase accessory factor